MDSRPVPPADKTLLEKSFNPTDVNRRKLLFGSGVALTSVLAGCSSESDSEGSTGDGTEGSTENDSETESEDEAPDSESGTEEDSSVETEGNPEIGDAPPYSISGSGPTEIEDVSVGDGLTIVEASHAGTGAFQVTLDETLVDETGAYEGETGGMLFEGKYPLEVQADGEWELSIRQPRPDSGESLPQTLTGEGNSVRGPFEFDGGTGATATHSGDGKFVVIVAPKKGLAEVVFNESGEYDGSTSFNRHILSWVVIEADGEWSIELQN